MARDLVLAVVPLRLASSRLPRKILADVAGLPLAARSLARVHAAFRDDARARVIAAVDDEETFEALRRHSLGTEVVMTDPSLPSGSDRVFAAVQHLLKREAGLRDEIAAVLNVQGDMPFAGADGLRQVGEYLRAAPPEVAIATLATPWPEGRPYADVSAVKVLANREGRALYFSRLAIPYTATAVPEQGPYEGRLHLGVYGYRLEALARFCAQAPVASERAESLEQLRALWLGLDIQVLETQAGEGESYRGVDTAEDLAWARAFAK